ncbi:MAG TPA: hypothetical protein VEW48_10495 [Thermoanaerobaculia bacterium]|nr:hypothetical protein [Thermoanaerobaculia bacterium]
MPTISLNGRITEKGELDLELPAGLPPGEARITIEIPIEPGWTPAELDRALEVVPLTGAEIVRGGFTGSWADQEISDGEGWVRERRHRRREERRGK